MNKDLVIIKTIEIKATPAKIWETLTSPERIKRYFFSPKPITDWQVGSPIEFEGVYEEGETKDGGSIIAIEKEKLLQYTYWTRFSGLERKEENYSMVSYKLEAFEEHTLLILSEQGFADEEAKEQAELNWTMILEEVHNLSRPY